MLQASPLFHILFHNELMKRRDTRSETSVSDARPVIWTVSVSRLSGLLRDVTPEFDARAKIENIHLGFEQAVTTLRGRLRRERCDVIIAAGSNGAYLRNRMDCPVVLVQPNGFDVMRALAQAHRVSPRMGLLTHETEVAAFSEFQKSFGLAITQRAFVTAEDARTQVREMVSAGCEVIVGTGMAADLAERAGIAGILLYSADTIRQAFNSALDIASALGSVEGKVSPRKQRSGRSKALRYSSADLIGDSAPMQQLRSRISRFGATEETVLICGETGTGKELVAQSLHGESARHHGPYVAVNCGAIAESLLESELFGHEEGAFTGARRGGHTGLIQTASGGTLFLDEIGELPLNLQTRLLRALEEREILRVGASRPVSVDIRVIAATHGNLRKMVAEKSFRADLYYRLNVLRLDLPALRERRGDSALLAKQFLAKALPRFRPEWSQEALALIDHHSWPGNVRELRNLMNRLAVFCSQETRLIDAPLLRACAPELFSDSGGDSQGELVRDPPFRRPRGAPSQETLAEVMQHAGGDRKAAAAMLGVSRTTLWRWLREPN